MSSRRLLPTLSVLLLSLGGCAARQAHVQEPTPCTDSLYVQLKRQHPDSLSERAWARLQGLEQACTVARAQHKSGMSGMSGMMGMGSRRGALSMVVVMAVGVGMVLMMAALR